MDKFIGSWVKDTFNHFGAYKILSLMNEQNTRYYFDHISSTFALKL
jgi:hypothetical protein